VFQIQIARDIPIGILQAMASIQQGTWYARSAEFLQTPAMQTLRWLRVPGDVLFAAGAAVLGLFVIGLITGHSYEKTAEQRGAEVAKEQGVLVGGD
jgi:nitric oxide reductase subunit B